MVRRKAGATPAGRIRREGARVTAGPWTLCGMESESGRLIVALGRAAGGAVTRTRIRRIARDALRSPGVGGNKTALLLLARGNVSTQPRRQIRRTLGQLIARLSGTPQRSTGDHRSHE